VVLAVESTLSCLTKDFVFMSPRDSPPENDGVPLLDLEFWPNLDIGNDLLHVDWLDGEVARPKASVQDGRFELQGSATGKNDRGQSEIASPSGPASLDRTLMNPDAMDHIVLDEIALDFPPVDVGEERNPMILQDDCELKDSSKIPSNKDTRRLRWTPELHALFVEAVHFLNGPSKATPKGIMKYMKVDGLTIFHIKSHLQKYRQSCHVPKPEIQIDQSRKLQKTSVSSVASMDSGGARDNADNVDHVSRIEQALQVQMQMQKRLQEQLEEQRKLQLSMQAHERHIKELKEMLESSKKD
jgi:SHAQKYF class myb-like DNA-binding protein